MSRIDWLSLERKYLTGNYASLKAFAADNGIKYNSRSRAHMATWIEKRVTAQRLKSDKVVRKTIEKQAEAEASLNAKHMQVWEKILGRIDAIADMDRIKTISMSGAPITIDVNHRMMADLASAMEKTQKGMRTADETDNRMDKVSELISRMEEAARRDIQS